MKAEEITTECHDGYVPAWAETELDRLYGNIYSSLAHFRLFGGLEDAYTYIARQGRDGKVLALFLFRLEQHRVVVLNEGMLLETEEVERFTSYIFQRFASVCVVEFHAVHAPMKSSSRPYQRYYQTEDFLLRLPDSPEAYLAMLGSATRKNVKKYLNRWQREFPETEILVFEKGQIGERDLRDVVSFNHMRMAAKNKVSAIDETEFQTMMKLAHECGLLCVTRVNGRVCAGTLLYRFGDHYVSRITAHDTQYDEHRLGTLACYWAINEAIRRGGQTFHFMWGRYPYKSALGGVLYELDHIAIYRSYWHLLRQSRLAAMTAYSGYQREAKMWLLNQAERGTGWMPRMLHAGVNLAKTLKRMRLGRATS